MSKTILVTGATGNIGSLVIPQLIEKGATVKAYVRDAAKAESLKELGAEIIVGDFMDQESLNKAAEGVDAVFAITPPNPDAVKQGEVILNAAKNSGSPFYLRLSAIGAAEDAPTENGKLHHQSDQALINSGLTYTILRPHFYMQNLFMAVESIQSQGNIYMGMGEGSLGMIDTRDVADCCVEILINGGHENKIYTPTGSESINFTRVAEILSDTVGKEVSYVPVPLEKVRESILEAGWGDWGAELMVQYAKAYSEGWGDFANSDVETITGNPARSFTSFSNEVLSSALKN